jgi:lysophospholipase L1-like esterase
MILRRSTFTAVFLCLASATFADTLPVEIKPDDPKIYYIGRFDLRDPKGPRCDWSNSMLDVRFHGTALQAKINAGNENDYALIVDHQPASVVHPAKGESVVDLAKDLPDGEHEVQLIKRTEGFVGIDQFEGFYLSTGGQLLEPKHLTHKIEVIGDSISCGYGNEAPNEKEKFTPKTENGAMTYGALTARALGAEYACIAWSGRKMSPNNTMPEIYDQTLATDKASKWDFSKWTADVVLINLATNDFGPGVPDEQQWTAAYEKFIHHLRESYPQAMIYVASGSMMSDGWPPEKKALSTLNRYLDRISQDFEAAGDAYVRPIHFDPQDGARDGLGADWHPNLKTHEKMAQTFISTLQRDLDWKPVDGN